MSFPRIYKFSHFAYRPGMKGGSFAYTIPVFKRIHRHPVVS